MNESIENIPLRTADLLASREVGKQNAGVLKTTAHSVDTLKDIGVAFMKARKYERGQLSEEDMKGITESFRHQTERTVALRQGAYEKETSQIVNPEKATVLQEEYEDKLNDITELPVGDQQEDESVNTMDIIHEIANFENSVYDQLMSEKLQKKQNQSLEGMSPEDATKIKKEVQEEMDEIVRDIGLNYLRGYIPGPIGNYFRNKAAKSTEKFSR